jgi:hypothetical protein
MSRRALVAVVAVVLGTVGCGGVTVEPREALEVGGIEYRVLTCVKSGDTVTIAMTAKNVSDYPRAIGWDGAESSFDFYLLARKYRYALHDADDASDRTLFPNEMLRFTLTAKRTTSLMDAKLQLRDPSADSPFDNKGKIKLG